MDQDKLVSQVIAEHQEHFQDYFRWQQIRKLQAQIAPGSTHLPVLVEIMKKSTGDVLEIGCGFASTPQLHHLCEAMGRTLVSLDNNPEWIEKLHHFRRDWHIVESCDWNNCRWFDKVWGMIFLDSAPAASRVPILKKIRDKSPFIIAHDSEDHAYQYEAAFAQFRYRKDFKELSTWTTILSNLVPL